MDDFHDVLPDDEELYPRAPRVLSTAQKLWGACGCGVPVSAPQAFHQTRDCDCRHHDLSECRTCAVEVLARHQLDELLPEIERRLKAEAEHGPFIV